MCHRMWNSKEVQESSTWPELKAIHFAILSFLDVLKGKTILWNTDNKNVVQIVETGSKKRNLQDLAILIFQLCKWNNIDVSMKWVPRNKNVQADVLSKFIDYNDWQISSQFFDFIDGIWGPHSIDRFVNSENKKTRKI